jgi:hypothetical protein
LIRDRQASIIDVARASRSGLRGTSPLAQRTRVNGVECRLALQLPFMEFSESMGNHDSKIVGADSVD